MALEKQTGYIRGIFDNLNYTKFLRFSPSFAYSLLSETSIRQLATMGYNMGIRTFVYSAAKRRKLEEELGFRLPVYTSFATSNYCNLACNGCYIDRSDPQVLPDTLLQKLIDNSGEMGIHTIMAFGGEPLHPKTRTALLDTVDNNSDYEFIICTNGTYLDSSVAREVSSLKNSFVLLSIDGFKKLNDQRRGKRTFDKIREAMTELKDRKVFYGVSATVTSHNISEVSSEAFLDFLIEQGVRFAYFHRFITKDALSDNMPQAGGYSTHIVRLKELARKKRIVIYDGELGNLYKGHLIRRSNNSLFVTESGIVTVERAGIPVGDLKKQTLLDILRGEEVAEIQRFKSERGTLNNSPQNLREILFARRGE